VVTHQLQVERRTGKVRQSETDVLQLCHATNKGMVTGMEIGFQAGLGKGLPPVPDFPDVPDLCHAVRHPSKISPGAKCPGFQGKVKMMK